MQFDARNAKLLQPGEHITLDDYPGLRLKATASGRAWIYRFKSPVDGRMRQIKIGAWPAMSYPAAIVAWEKLKNDRDAGKDPAVLKREERKAARESSEQQRSKKKSVLSVKDVCDLYITGYIDLHRKEKGAGYVRWLFDTMIPKEFSSLQAESITRSQAFDLLNSHIKTPVLAANLRAELGSTWDYALDAGRLPETTPNWWRNIMRGKLKSKGKKVQGVHVGTSKRVLTESELKLLLPWLPNFSETVRDVLTLYLWTGARGAEIVATREEEITEESDGLWLTMPKARTKNARHENATDHRVPLVGRAKEIILRRMKTARNGFLFPSNIKRVHHVEQKSVQVAVHYHQPYSKTHPKNDRPRLPVTHWAPHDLRRTARTLLASLGCPGDTAEVIIGHMLPGVKGVYDRHTYDKERREWLTRLDAHLESLAR